MLLFFDTEFTSLNQQAKLLSLAIIDEGGRTFYAEFIDYNPDELSDWIKSNVISQFFLTLEKEIYNQNTFIRGNDKYITSELKLWLSHYQSTTCRFVADVYMYDWVLFAELFGGALNLPSFIDFIPIDFASILYAKGENPHKPRIEFFTKSEMTKLKDYYPQLSIHSALFDTLLLSQLYKKFVKSNG